MSGQSGDPARIAGDPAQISSTEPKSRIAAINLFFYAEAHNIAGIRQALQEGADINAVDPQIGLCALHVAVGNNDIVLCRFLIEECGARFFPDRFGRWPTLIAAECQVDDELSDYIVEKEAAYLAQNPS